MVQEVITTKEVIGVKDVKFEGVATRLKISNANMANLSGLSSYINMLQSDMLHLTLPGKPHLCLEYLFLYLLQVLV